MNLITRSLDPSCGHYVDAEELSPDNVIESEIRASGVHKPGGLADAVWKGVLARLEHERVENSESEDLESDKTEGDETGCQL
jgi:hypothetical protein